MHVIETSSGSKHQIEIIPLEDGDYKSLTKTRYFFDWKTEQGYEVYKLRIAGSFDVLGIISLERIPQEWRVHIRLLTVSIENKGEGKQYDMIAGNMIAFAAKIAVREYAEYACVSLKPKSQIAQHYIDRYQMRITGMTLSIEVPEILDLIKSYDNE
ncbi:N-acetyltransferase [uncultured Algoriphagus sp.]|uniref:N-acetyltransferase n=1 Tax=uncultured Algoriphagus sp. TaxID=417365 RepID=UPI0030EE4C97|tara:strand:+ start:57120 stop:57587 length:468 start_codon:yes stop_codon:yes gene_type:complete